jgi:CRP-like cAMP-binding protein
VTQEHPPVVDDPEQTVPQDVAGRSIETATGPVPRHEATFFRHLFARNREEKSNADLLSEIPLFDMLSKKELKLLAALVHERDYAAGELICEQGTPGAAMYIVKKGAVELFRQDAQGRPVRRLGILNEGAFFGESALLEGGARFMSARATEPTDALVFFRADLDQIVARMPITGTKILQKLAWVIYRMAEAAMEELYKEQP